MQDLWCLDTARITRDLLQREGKEMTDAEWKINIRNAVEAQANDQTLWSLRPTVHEAYVLQSLRWLHRVIEDRDDEALSSIIAQSEDNI